MKTVVVEFMQRLGGAVCIFKQDKAFWFCEFHAEAFETWHF
jgi:hypothetical protein